MPTYEYECEACKHHFDEFQSITAKPLKKCPACGKPKLQRLIGGGAAVIFKGSGFYQTDYRSESYKQSAKKDQTTPAETGGDKAGESKTAASPAKDAGKAGGESKAKPGKSSKSES